MPSTPPGVTARPTNERLAGDTGFVGAHGAARRQRLLGVATEVLRGRCKHSVHYEHKRSDAELLLGIPDAIAWCWAKGGQWQRLVERVVQIHDV
jgi:hypothetical protein